MSVALYHPYIEPNPHFLKTALLYWDGVQTIVPEGLADPFSHETSREAVEEGFLIPRTVSSDSRSVQRASLEIGEDIDRAAVRRASQKASFRLHGQKVPRVHRQKLSMEQRQRLGEELAGSLFEGDPTDEEGFYQVSHGFGLAYLSRLASALSDEDESEPVTDEAVGQDVVLDGHIDDRPARGQAAQVELARLTLQMVRVRPNTSLRQIVRFRERHRDELERFRGHLHRLGRRIGRATARSDLEKECRESVEEEIRPQIEELEARMRENRIGYGFTGMEVAQACVIGLVGSGFQNVELGLAGGIGSLALSACRLRRAQQAEQRERTFGYLVDARRRLGG
jgi:hypothetical protein